LAGVASSEMALRAKVLDCTTLDGRSGDDGLANPNHKILRGLTWEHPRGYAPLIAGVPEYEKQHPEIKIRWDRRSLREFGEAPIEQYINAYDLLIIDHPFVGFAAGHNLFVNFAPHLNKAEKLDFAKDSVGPSWHCYLYGGGVWALPIDSAAQVASYRSDLLSKFRSDLPETFDEVIELSKKLSPHGKFIILPACPTDAVSLVLTLTASLGYPITEESEEFISKSVGAEVLGRLHHLISLAHPKCVHWNPIQVYDYMVSTSDAVFCPYAFGYCGYSGLKDSPRLKFANPPGIRPGAAVASLLGGTGVAVSKQSGLQMEAIGYAKWLVSPEHQRGTYFFSGGQPSSLSAWTDPRIDAAAGGFFSDTLRTLQNAYVRPRFDGFVKFFEAAGIEINRCLRGNLPDDDLIAWLNANYARLHNRIKTKELFPEKL